MYRNLFLLLSVFLSSREVKGQGYSLLKIPPNDSASISIQPGMQLVFTFVGSWNPDLKEAQGYDSTYISGYGLKTLRIGNDTFHAGKGTDYCNKFKAPELNFFSVIWSDRNKANYKQLGEIEWTNNVGPDERVLLFQMNDEMREYYNNKGDMSLIYYLQPDKGYPWNLWNDWSDRIELSKNYLNNEIAINHPHIKGLKYYSMISEYNRFSDAYYYVLLMQNSSLEKLRLKITIFYEKGTIETATTLNPGEFYRNHWFVKTLNQKRIIIEKI